MAKLIITRGLPGSGKTRRARKWVDADPARRARVNRDDLRTMFHGGRLGTNEQEQRVTVVQQDAISTLLAAGMDVICDDTNLVPEHLDDLRSLAAACRADVEVWDMTDVPIDVCIERDARREGTARVGEEVIRDMWERHLKPALPEEPENLSVVRVSRPDNLARVAQRLDHHKDSGNSYRWYIPGDTNARTWQMLLDEPPGTTVHRLVPESEAFPADLARRLVDALGTVWPWWHNAGHLDTLQDCDNPMCRDWRPLLAEAEAALAKAVE